MKHLLLAGLASLALAGCATAPAETERTAPAVRDAAAWDEFVQSRLAQWFTIDPNFAVYQGAHQYDGQFSDWSEAGLDRKANFLRTLIADAGTFSGLAPDKAFERDYMVQVAKGQLFWLEDADQPHTNPGYYIGALDPNVYVSREYADKPTRMKAMIGFFDNVARQAPNIRSNLKTPMPATFIKLAGAGFSGFADYYRGDARAAFADVKDAALQSEFKAASERAAVEMDRLAAWIESEKARQTPGGYALGAARFARMVKATEAVDTPLDELEAVGRADLARNQAALKDACAKLVPGKSIAECFQVIRDDKPADSAVEEARRQIPKLTEFVRAKSIVTIPGTEKALVRESPPYNRQNSAYIDPPGPYEKGIPSIYYISPPDPTWPEQKQLDYIPGKDDLLFTSIHEVMPGHFLQFLHSNRSPSWIGKLFVGYAFAEGWAHYSEELMWEAGYGNGDPAVHVGQLSNALLRNCRYLSAIGLHARGMTVAQSKTMFMDECYQDEGTADQQSARGTYDPAYLNYTLGKLMIRKLRADWTATRGGRDAWKSFHDAFLSYGGPPIPLVRQSMMNEDAPHSEF